uniref:DDE Tnp4 domain-containing protein n=1 Tax=Daphnia galeata TaxID=27404 RepID=A0A8J2WE66_9CRUS|nr:unnamed protein product [Daphnia galeata]
MDLRPILGLISFLQQEEDEEDEDILAILSIIKFSKKNGNTPYKISLLLKYIMKQSQRRRIIRDQGRTARIVLPGYAEMVFRYRDIQFSEDYRMSRERFQELLQIIAPALCRDFINDGEPVRNKLLLGIWAFSTRESFREIANRFGLRNRSSAHNVFVKVCKLISDNSQLFIQWPQEDEYARLAALNSFPDALGFIDGSFIPLIQPKHSGKSYFNRKKFYSVTLQAVCTGDQRIIDVSVGYPSSMNDKRVFKCSSLGRGRLERLLHGTNYHLLGDGGYTLGFRMMVPFRRDHELQQFEIRFNAALSSNRQIIERVFARLKGKFRRLRTYDVKNLDYFNDMIVAACCLHNFTLDMPFELDYEREQPNELNDDFDLLDEDLNEELDERAIEKRNIIAAYYAEALEESEGEEE